MKPIGKLNLMTMMTKTIENKKVRFEYTIIETYEAGIVLTGN